MRRIGPALSIALLAAGACSSSDSTESTGEENEGGLPPTCVPGDQKQCDCVGGATTGIQICKSDGKAWDVCTGCGVGSPCGECDGCCNGTTCVSLSGEDKARCGAKGSSCSACDNGFACAQGRCVVDTGQCSPVSCPTGCCQANQCWQPSEQFYGACGKGGEACVVCTYGSTCFVGACNDQIDPHALFAIRVLTLKVKEHDSGGSAWDAGGGLPDPFVCIGVPSKSACTPACQDSTTCSFTGTSGVIGGSSPLIFTGADLKELRLSVYDEDWTSNDLIGTGTTSVDTVFPAYLTGPFASVLDITYVLY